jgi:RNase P subunit RPR2
MLSCAMPICPHCESDLSEWTATLRQASDTNAPQVWTCPDCDVVLGVSTGRP